METIVCPCGHQWEKHPGDDTPSICSECGCEIAKSKKTVTCHCGHHWEILPKDPEPYLCHECGCDLSEDGYADNTTEARCWEGYEPVPGVPPYEKGSCRKKKGKKKKKAKASTENLLLAKKLVSLAKKIIENQ